MATRGHTPSQALVTKKASPSSNKTPSPRRGRRGSVTFVHQTSIYPDDGEGEEQQGLLKGSKEEEEVDQRPIRGNCYGCHFLVENKLARRLFRVCAVLNLISLVFSAPLRQCDPAGGNEQFCDHVFVQLIIIAVVDFLLAILYSLQTYVRFQYSLYQYQRKKQVCGLHVKACCSVWVGVITGAHVYTNET